jgi:hypothetical protein
MADRPQKKVECLRGMGNDVILRARNIRFSSLNLPMERLAVTSTQRRWWQNRSSNVAAARCFTNRL